MKGRGVSSGILVAKSKGWHIYFAEQSINNLWQSPLLLPYFRFASFATRNDSAHTEGA